MNKNIVFMFIVLSICPSCNLSKILFVFEMFRHGTRSSLFNMTNLPDGKFIDNFHIKWDNKGGLTNLGYRMLYTLGVHNKLKYKDFIASLKIPQDIYVLSTTVTRAYESAQSFLMGLFPHIEHNDLISESTLPKSFPPNNITDSILKELSLLNSKTLPYGIPSIPINFISEKEIYTILSYEKYCPNISSLKSTLRKSDRINNFLSKVNNTYGKQILHYFNLTTTPSALFNYTTMFNMFENFVTCFENNKNLTSLVNEGINLELFNQFGIEMRTNYLRYVESNEETSPFAVSITIPKIIEWMDNIVYQKNISSMPKYVIYSGHDSTLSPFELYFQKVFDVEWEYPNFGANLYLEIEYDEKDEEYYVRYLFNDKVKFVKKFEEFRKDVLKGLWSKQEINKFCGLNTNINMKYAGIIIVSFLVVIGIIFIYIYKKNIKKNKKKNEEENKGEELVNK